MTKEALKEWRAQRKLSQEAAAQKIGVSVRTIVRWEKGTHSPSRLAAEKLGHLGLQK